MIKIKTLLENSLSQNLALKAEHGLSFFIEKDGKKILFDCSSGGAALYNAQKMNVNLQELDYIVVSHSHYDHAGGLPELINQGLRVPLYIGQHFWEEKYAYDGQQYTYLGCGFNQESLLQKGIPIHTCEKITKVFEGCYLVTDFKRCYSFEIVPKRFVKKVDEEFIEDDFADEISMVLESDKGLVVIVGCSHPGILNMLTTILERFSKPIYAVFGGSHLVEADEERIKKTQELMEIIGIRILGFNHCTGEEAKHYFLECPGQMNYFHLKSGDCYRL